LLNLLLLLLLLFQPLAGELYQHFELGTAEIGSLQEVTDEALDATAAAKLHHSHTWPQQQSAASEHADLEKAVSSAAAGGLSDWRRLQTRLEASTWRDALDRVCGAERLGLPLLQQQVRCCVCSCGWVLVTCSLRYVKLTHFWSRVSLFEVPPLLIHLLVRAGLLALQMFKTLLAHLVLAACASLTYSSMTPLLILSTYR
jgi:hypothetical protein